MGLKTKAAMQSSLRIMLAIVSAFEKFNVLDFSFDLIKGKGFRIVLQSLYRLVRYGSIIERSVKDFLRGP
ncbi:unnamed protein product [Clonostachys chloroleuca]|uniref:Uncharacterized protein n=1 Tax=Clonostachys chloroleuca TaxID=1926264 RepID=A0AA35LWS2_9HYPO|nr:unnamed protein product [Clonostachys chloroleuca]